MAEFPMAVVDVLHDRFKELLDERDIVDRPVRASDPSRCVGLYPVDWTPTLDSFEIGVPTGEPTLGNYLYRIQALVKATSEEEGRVVYAKDTKILRAIVYRDTELRVRLHDIRETTLGYIEKVKRFGIVKQRYLNNELQGQFIFLATSDLWVETELSPA